MITSISPKEDWPFPGGPFKAQFPVGTPVIWKCQPNGGYGYVLRVAAVVTGHTAKRVRIDAALDAGGVKSVLVKPESLVSE